MMAPLRRRRGNFSAFATSLEDGCDEAMIFCQVGRSVVAEVFVFVRDFSWGFKLFDVGDLPPKFDHLILNNHNTVETVVTKLKLKLA